MKFRIQTGWQSADPDARLSSEQLYYSSLGNETQGVKSLLVTKQREICFVVVIFVVVILFSHSAVDLLLRFGSLPCSII